MVNGCGAFVNEEQVRFCADHIARALKEYGWEYIIIDLRWSYLSCRQEKSEWDCLDEYARVVPDSRLFPSSADGKGLKVLADYIHSLGLKIGIQMETGIPCPCVENHAGIFGSGATADRIVDSSVPRNEGTGLYRVDCLKKGAREYYDSIFMLYASWNLDFVEVRPSANSCPHQSDAGVPKEEMDLIFHALESCGRDIVLAVGNAGSPSGNPWLAENYVGIWKTSGGQVNRCCRQVWPGPLSLTSFADSCLPFLNQGNRDVVERKPEFETEERRSVLTLMSMFRWPLMFGLDLAEMDDESASLLMNEEVLAIQKKSRGVFRLLRDDEKCIFVSYGNGCPAKGVEVNIAIFNFRDETAEISVDLKAIRNLLPGTLYCQRDLWERKNLLPISGGAEIIKSVAPHGTVLVQLK